VWALKGPHIADVPMISIPDLRADHAGGKCGTQQQVRSMHVLLLCLWHNRRPSFCKALPVDPDRSLWISRYLVRRCLRRRDWHHPLAWLGLRPVGHDDQSAGGERQHHP
jgi:hypothetical protein